MVITLDDDEARLVLHSHLVEKLGFDPGSIRRVVFIDKETGGSIKLQIEVSVTTDMAVPKGGPYRTKPA